MTEIAKEGGRFSQTALTSRDREALQMDLIYLFIYFISFGLLLFHLHVFFFLSPPDTAASLSSAITHKKVSTANITFNSGERFSKGAVICADEQYFECRDVQCAK